MRLTQKKIEEIIMGILGQESLPLLKQLYGKQNVSEFELASRTKKDIKVIRKMLYILYNHNLVSFTRKKDKLKGWYVYYWTLVPESVRYNYVKQKKEMLATLQSQLQEEQKGLFFACPTRCVRLNFDQAMDVEFHCPECGELLTQEENKMPVQQLRQRIKALQEEIKECTMEVKVRKKTVKAKEKVKKALQRRKKAKKKR